MMLYNFHLVLERMERSNWVKHTYSNPFSIYKKVVLKLGDWG